MKGLYVLVVLISLGLVASCGSRQSGHYSEESIDGIRVISNSLIDAKAEIQLIEELSIGMDEGDDDYMLSYPRDIDADSEGNIYVLDTRDATIKKYDPHGKHITNIGRHGQGPGEFEDPRTMCINAQDEIFVNELMSLSITRMDSEGVYLGAIDVERRIDDFRILSDGSLIIGHKASLQSGEGKTEFEYQVGRFDPAIKQFDVFYTEKQSRTARVSDGSFTLEFPNFVRWAVSSDENTYAAVAYKYEVDMFRPAGDLMSRFGLDLDSIPVSGDVLKKTNEIFDRLETGLDINLKRERELIKFYPQFDSIHIDERDRVWIQRYRPYWRDKPEEETVYDVFSAEGIFLYSMRIPGRITSGLLFKHGCLYAISSEEAGYSKAYRFKVMEE